MASDMTAKPMHGRSTMAAAMIAAGALVLATSVADAATASIYKCLGANLVVIYTDQPCKGGEQLDIRAGDAEGSLIGWRVQSSVDRNMVQRRTSSVAHNQVNGRGSFRAGILRSGNRALHNIVDLREDLDILTIGLQNRIARFESGLGGWCSRHHGRDDGLKVALAHHRTICEREQDHC